MLIVHQRGHTGSMVQVGLNMGPRDCRFLGPAVSYVKAKNLSEETKQDHDREVIGAMSLAWNFACSSAPSEIIDNIRGSIEDAGFPDLYTQNIEQGTIYIS